MAQEFVDRFRTCPAWSRWFRSRGWTTSSFTCARLLPPFPARNPDDLFRLPVDRAFSVAGIGTVVTGTAWSGRMAPGDHVMLLPSRKTARVRTVQVHGVDASTAEPGMRVALGLAGVAREEVSRGDTIVGSG